MQKIVVDFEKAKDNIIFQLVNTEQNREMLKGMPHRDFRDLSVIYKWVLSVNPEGMDMARVDNALSARLNLNEEQLFALAAENTRKILSPCVTPIDELLREMGMKTIEEIPLNQTMWVISNEKRMYGAASMLYEDKLQTLARKIGTDLYILPSSVHEVIAVSAIRNPEELAKIVSEINTTQVPLEERLSNQVYYYDKDLRKLTMATSQNGLSQADADMTAAQEEEIGPTMN